MNFVSNSQLLYWLRKHRKNLLGSGSQGECYLVDNKVFKFFWQFIDTEFEDDMAFNKQEILQFSGIENDTYIWPNDVITVGDKVVGYIADYVDSKSLFEINPFRVNLDEFVSNIEKTDKDIRIISNNGVLSYDVAYNTLYSENGFKVIDTMEYSRSDKDPDKLYRHNLKMFLYESRLFLIDGCFDKFLEDNKQLYDMYYDEDANFLEFVREFRKKLSEYEGHDIITLGEAKKSISFTNERSYVRSLYKCLK